MLTYLMLSKIYYVKSEYEVENGYLDILLLQRSGIPVEYEAVLEIKYIKKKEYEDKVKYQNMGNNPISNEMRAKDQATLDQINASIAALNTVEPHISVGMDDEGKPVVDGFLASATPEQYSTFLEAYIQYGDEVFDELNMTDEQLEIMGYTVSPEIEKARQQYIQNQEDVAITNKLIEEAKEEIKREEQFQEDLKEERAESIDKNLEQQELTDIVSTQEGKQIYEEQQMRKLLGLPVLKGDMTADDIAKEAEYYETGRSFNDLTQGDKMKIDSQTKNAENIAFNEQLKAQQTEQQIEAPEAEAVEE